MNALPNTPQDYGHPDNNLDGDQMSKNAEHEKPADPRLDPEVGEHPRLNKRDGEEISDDEAAGPPSLG